MVYDLWDTETGTAVAFERDDREMATLVRTLAAEYGVAFANELHLTIKEDGGSALHKLSGPALLAWAEEIDGNHGHAMTVSGVAKTTAHAKSTRSGIAAKPASGN